MERHTAGPGGTEDSDVDIVNGNSGILERNGSVTDVHQHASEKRGDIYLSPCIDGDARLYAPVDGPVRWNTFGISRNMTVNGNTVESFAGYRSVRATHGAYRGTWMYEVIVVSDLGEGVGIRLGWSTKKSNLNEPVGANIDGYGFCVCSGRAVHDRRQHVLANATENRKTVTSGDVISCVVHLAEHGRPFEPAASDIVQYKGRIHIRMYPEGTSLPKQKCIPGSFIELFVNGTSQGRAFQGSILEGTYYPTVSLFSETPDPSKVAKVKANFGMDVEGKSPWLCEYGDMYISTVTKSVSMLSHAGTQEDSI